MKNPNFGKNKEIKILYIILIFNIKTLSRSEIRISIFLNWIFFIIINHDNLFFVNFIYMIYNYTI